jgi:type II secretory pathway pseudopilin PulG
VNEERARASDRTTPRSGAEERDWPGSASALYISALERQKEPLMRRFRSQAGVTYLEVLILMVLAGIISALIVPGWTDEIKAKRYEEAFGVASQLAESMETYYASHGTFSAERDSLLLFLPSPDLLINPLTGLEWIIEIQTAGQEYLITGEGKQPIEIQTEDRWPEYKKAWEGWVALQDQLRRQTEQARRGRRGGG